MKFPHPAKLSDFMVLAQIIYPILPKVRRIDDPHFVRVCNAVFSAIRASKEIRAIISDAMSSSTDTEWSNAIMEGIAPELCGNFSQAKKGNINIEELFNSIPFRSSEDFGAVWTMARYPNGDIVHQVSPATLPDSINGQYRCAERTKTFKTAKEVHNVTMSHRIIFEIQ